MVENGILCFQLVLNLQKQNQKNVISPFTNPEIDEFE